MKSDAEKAVEDRRRRRLRDWIDTQHAGKQASFVAMVEINQGELSALLKNKTFGERKARSIERSAGMPPFWLDGADHASSGDAELDLLVSQARSFASTQSLLPGEIDYIKTTLRLTLHAAEERARFQVGQPPEPSSLVSAKKSIATA